MKLTITHLKAPWPAGAAIGDVIDLPSVPPWALGKCAPAAENAVATVAFDKQVDAQAAEDVVDDAAATVASGDQADAPAGKPDTKAKTKG